MTFDYSYHRSNAVEVAKEIRALSGIKKDPVDLFHIMNYFGIKYIDDDLRGADGYTLHIVDKDKYLVCYDHNRFGLHRSRFTIAHELGHIFLHHFRDEITSTELILHLDYEANNFAGALLMPEEIFENCQGMTFRQIMYHYKISKRALETRLRKINEQMIWGECQTGFCPYCGKFMYQHARHRCDSCGLAL